MGFWGFGVFGVLGCLLLLLCNQRFMKALNVILLLLVLSSFLCLAFYDSKSKVLDEGFYIWVMVKFGYFPNFRVPTQPYFASLG